MNILFFIWELPQNILGLLVLLFNKLCKSEIKQVVNSDGIRYYIVDHLKDCGVSLGNYILLDSNSSISEKTVKHEYGHQLQSRKLGWLYLLVIGIPSLGGWIYDQIFHKYWDTTIRYRWYYNQKWEKWADELGNVRR